MSIAEAKVGEIWGYTGDLGNIQNPTGPLIKKEINILITDISIPNKLRGQVIGENDVSTTTIDINGEMTRVWKKKTICDGACTRGGRGRRNKRSGGTRRNYRR